MQVLLRHRRRLRLVTVIEMLLVHQYHIIVRHRDFRQPGMVGTCQINLLERQAQSDGDRGNQHIVRAGYPPTFTEHPVAESLYTFYRSGIVNAEADIPVTGQHRLPLFILQSTGRNKQVHRPGGLFGKCLKQLHTLFGNNPKERVGYQIYLRAKLLEHRGGNAEIHRQQRLAFYKIRSFLNRTAQ